MPWEKTQHYINFRLNRLGDDGGQAICRALLKNSTLTHVHLGSNALGEPTAAILSQDGGKSLQEGMEENTTIQSMDLRLTEVGQENEYCINQLLKRNREEQYQQGRNS